MEAGWKEGIVRLKYSVAIENRTFMVEIVKKGGRRVVFCDGRAVDLDFGEESSGSIKSMIIDSRPFEVWCSGNGSRFLVSLNNTSFDVSVARGLTDTHKRSVACADEERELITAPMPGMVIDVKVEIGKSVRIGEPLVILEAMKMENELRTPVDGTIEKIFIQRGARVEKGEKLVVITR